MSRLIPAIAFSVALASALPSASISTPMFPGSASLTAASIAEAIEAGQAGSVTAYRLRRAINGPRDQPAIAVYTPYIRVGLAASVAAKHGIALHASEIPSWITAPIVHVVFRSPCAQLPCVYPGFGQIDESTLPIVAAGRFMAPDDEVRQEVPHPALKRGLRAPAAIALQVTTELGFLDALGGPPFDDTMVAAAFHASALKPGRTVYALWALGEDMLRVYRGSQIFPGDLDELR